MGACASVPKDMSAEARSAPPPEPAKEEITADVAEEKKPEEGDDHKEKENVKVVEDNDKHQSLGSLLIESEEVKESPKAEKITQTEAIPSETVIKEEEEPKAAEALPVTDLVAVVTTEPEKTAKVAPIVDAAKEEKKTQEN